MVSKANIPSSTQVTKRSVDQEDTCLKEFILDLACLSIVPRSEGGADYAVIEARSNARWWLIPLEDRRLAMAGLEMLQPISRGARIAKASARMLAKLGLQRSLRKVRIRLSDLSELSSFFDVQELRFAFFTGTAGPHRKTAVQIMDDRGKILGYAKLSRNEFLQHYIRHEAGMLNYMADLDLKSVDIPKVLTLQQNEKFTLMVTDSVKSSAHIVSLEINELHIRFLRELYRKTYVPGGVAALYSLEDRLVMIDGVAGAIWLERMRKGIATVRPHICKLTLTFAHGDFTPWNTFIQDDRLYVFDWEYAQSEYPMGYDYVHFRLMTVRLEKQPNIIPLLIVELKNLFYDGDEALGRQALLYSLLLHAAFYLNRLWESGGVLNDWPEGIWRSVMIDHLIEVVDGGS